MEEGRKTSLDHLRPKGWWDSEPPPRSAHAAEAHAQHRRLLLFPPEAPGGPPRRTPEAPRRRSLEVLLLLLLLLLLSSPEFPRGPRRSSETRARTKPGASDTLAGVRVAACVPRSSGRPRASEEHGPSRGRIRTRLPSCCLDLRLADTYTLTNIGPNYYFYIHFYVAVHVVGQIVQAVVSILVIEMDMNPAVGNVGNLGWFIGEIFFACYLAGQRTKLRQALGDPSPEEKKTMDFVCYWCCACCTSIQEGRQVDEITNTQTKCCFVLETTQGGPPAAVVVRAADRGEGRWRRLGGGGGSTDPRSAVHRRSVPRRASIPTASVPRPRWKMRAF